jgi:hypothetical protein
METRRNYVVELSTLQNGPALVSEITVGLVSYTLYSRITTIVNLFYSVCLPLFYCSFILTTCTIWQSSGYPCGHAISILHSQKQDPQRYVESIFTIPAYKKTYEQPIIPLDLTNVNGDEMHSLPATVVSDEEDPESVEDDSVLPPSTRRPRSVDAAKTGCRYDDGISYGRGYL